MKRTDENHDGGGPAVFFLICLMVAVGAAYYPVRHFEFVNFDDPQYITQNPIVRKGLTAEGVRWAFSTFHTGNWHPLTWLSHMLDVTLFGVASGPHHAVNVVWHAVNTVLLFHLLRAMTGRPLASGLTAALFALHPLHVESVAWVSERKDVLSGFFWIMTLAAYHRFAATRRIGFYLAALFLFASGLMAKPMIVTLPCVMLLMDAWPLERFQGRDSPIRLAAEKIPFFVLSAVSSGITLLAQESGGAVGSLAMYPFGLRAANAAVACTGYLLKTVFPVRMAVLYPFPDAVPLWKSMAAAACLAGITLTGLRMIRSRPWFLTGWLWYLGTLVPVIGLLKVGLQSMADRYTYLPLIGIFIMTAWAFQEMWDRYARLRAAAGTLALAALLGLTGVSARQAGVWKNSRVLFSHALEVTDDNWGVHRFMGNALMAEEDIPGAAAHYRNAAAIRPDNADLHYRLGAALARQGDSPGALAAYQEAVRRDPEMAEAYNGMGNLMQRMNRMEAAVDYYREAIRVNPGFGDAHNNLGVALSRQGAPDRAIPHFRRALELNPDNPGPRANLERALTLIGGNTPP